MNSIWFLSMDHSLLLYVIRIEIVPFQGDAGYQDMLDCVGSLATVCLGDLRSRVSRKPHIFQHCSRLILYCCSYLK